MSKFFMFNDKLKHIIRIDDLDYSYICESTNKLKIVFTHNNGNIYLDYNDNETIEKDVVRLARFLNKKEKLL